MDRGRELIRAAHIDGLEGGDYERSGSLWIAFDYPGDLPGPKDWPRLCKALVETALQYLRAAEDRKASRSNRVKSLKEANRLMAFC